jgi:indolepyruvate ferredoxin oxidoreductase alpha subunit
MSLAYIGVKGGMVVIVADDPGPISSQTEQDTRHFARFAKLPVFDPSSPEEAFDMVREAFAYSEKYGTPVILRPTTRVCHSCADIELPAEPVVNAPESFIKDSFRWVVFPKTSYLNHLKIEERNPKIGEDFSSLRYNRIIGEGKKGVACGGISYAYVEEALEGVSYDGALFKVSTPHPVPEKLALEFLRDREEVLVMEELDSVIERELIYLCGKHHLSVNIHGKLDGSVSPAGENTIKSVKGALGTFLGLSYPVPVPEPDTPKLPVRRLCCARAVPTGFILRGEVRYEREEGRIQRRYRLLYAGERQTSRHGGHLPLHGGRRHHRSGTPQNRAGYGQFRVHRRLHLLCLGPDRRR